MVQPWRATVLWKLPTMIERPNRVENFDQRKHSFDTLSSKDETTDSRSSWSDDSHFFMMKKKISPSNSKMKNDRPSEASLHEDWK